MALQKSRLLKKVHSCTHQQLNIYKSHINHFDVTRKKPYQTWPYTND